MGFCDFETETEHDLFFVQGRKLEVVGNRVVDSATGEVPSVNTKCGAMVVWDRPTNSCREVGGLDTPERMVLSWGDESIDRVYFHNSRFDMSFILSWFWNQDVRETKQGEYIKIGKQRVWLKQIIKGNQNQLYCVRLCVEGERMDGKPIWKQNVEVWDSKLIWSSSLDELGKVFGVEKGGTTGGSQAVRIGCDDVMREYCMQDCRVLQVAMSEYFKMVKDAGGNEDGYMTAGATTYHLAMIWLCDMMVERLMEDDKMVRAARRWCEKHPPKTEKDAGKDDMRRYVEHRLRYDILPNDGMYDLRTRKKDADGEFIKKGGMDVYEMYDKLDKDGNVVRKGKGRFSWLRKGYKGAVPLMNWRRTLRASGICGKVIVKDVNSMFPFQMRTKPMPYGKPVRIDADECRELMDSPREDVTWACRLRLLAKVKKGHRGTFLEKNGQTVNDAGYETKALDTVDGEYVICEPEWRLLLRDYDVYDCEIVEAVRFKAKVGMFGGYIDKWYEVKNNAKGGMKAFAKLLLNALYGKFGTSPYREGHEYELVDGVLKDKLVSDETDERNEYYLPIAMWTTAYARDMLSQGCNAIGWDNVIYTDTDSWHVVGLEEEVIDARLRSIGVGDSKDLGDAKTEGVYAYGVYVRAKGYAHFDEEGRLVEAKFGGANRFPMLGKMENWLKPRRMMVGDKMKEGLFGYRLMGFQVKGGVLLMNIPVNLYDTSIKGKKRKVIG